MHFFSILTKHYIACSSVYIIKAFLVKPKVSHAVALNFIFLREFACASALNLHAEKRLMGLYWINELVHSHYPWRVNCFHEHGVQWMKI
jgi:hypothetical protein